MTEYVDALINDTYELKLPEFRRDFHLDRPKWEAGRLDHCHEVMCGREWTVYDIGAEHGDFTALYRTWLAGDAEVIPVEPMAHYWPFIRGTFEANELLAPTLSFVGLVSENTYGKRRPDTSWPVESRSEGVPDGGFAHLHRNREHPSTRIDDLATWEPPDALILDIEGAEWNALVGAGHTLANFRPHVWVSVHDIGDGDWPGPLKGWYGRTAADIDELMASFGYSATELPNYGEGERFMYYEPR